MHNRNSIRIAASVGMFRQDLARTTGSRSSNTSSCNAKSFSQFSQRRFFLCQWSSQSDWLQRKHDVRASCGHSEQLF